MPSKKKERKKKPSKAVNGAGAGRQRHTSRKNLLQEAKAAEAFYKEAMEADKSGDAERALRLWEKAQESVEALLLHPIDDAKRQAFTEGVEHCAKRAKILSSMLNSQGTVAALGTFLLGCIAPVICTTLWFSTPMLILAAVASFLVGVNIVSMKLEVVDQDDGGQMAWAITSLTCICTTSLWLYRQSEVDMGLPVIALAIFRYYMAKAVAIGMCLLFLHGLFPDDGISKQLLLASNDWSRVIGSMGFDSRMRRVIAMMTSLLIWLYQELSGHFSCFLVRFGLLLYGWYHFAYLTPLMILFIQGSFELIMHGKRKVENDKQDKSDGKSESSASFFYLFGAALFFVAGLFPSPYFFGTMMVVIATGLVAVEESKEQHCSRNSLSFHLQYDICSASTVVWFGFVTKSTSLWVCPLTFIRMNVVMLAWGAFWHIYSAKLYPDNIVTSKLQQDAYTLVDTSQFGKSFLLGKIVGLFLSLLQELSWHNSFGYCLAFAILQYVFEVPLALNIARYFIAVWHAQAVYVDLSILKTVLTDATREDVHGECDEKADLITTDVTPIRPSCQGPPQSVPNHRLGGIVGRKRICGGCGVNLKGKPRKICKGCFTQPYCDRDCQKRHWNRKKLSHRDECSALKKLHDEVCIENELD